jgi:hypothetical protein
LVDERDRPGGQVTFVGEDNVTVDADTADAAFPLQHPLVPALLIRWERSWMMPVDLGRFCRIFLLGSKL